MDKLPSAEVVAERLKILRRLQALTVNDDALHHRAVIELAHRLKSWHGEAKPRIEPINAKHRQTPTTLDDVSLETLLIRAISARTDPPTFGVNQDGAVFTTDASHWNRSGRLIFVTGLSAPLDEVAQTYRVVAGGEGRLIAKGAAFFGEIPTVEDHPFTFLRPTSHGIWQRITRMFDPQNGLGGLLAQATGRVVVPPLIVDFDAGPWPAEGVLSEMGYRVGKNGLPTDARREILRRVYWVELVTVSPMAEDYAHQWGTPGSSTRRNKMVGCLSKFIAMAERKTTVNMTAAITDWREDLAWMRKIL